MLNRLIYLGYYFKELDGNLSRKFVNYVSGKMNWSATFVWLKAIKSSIQYNISILDYFYFRFFELSAEARESYSGTGFMYEYQLKMNPPDARLILEDKILFLRTYHPFFKRNFWTLIDLIKMKEERTQFKSLESEHLVLKNSKGQVGREVEVINTDDFSLNSLIDYLQSKKYDLVEEFVFQHPKMKELSPSGLNTVRIITQLVDNEVEILGARLRISINSQVDNLGAGNIAAPIEVASGKVSGPAVFSDITKDDVICHPVTGLKIPGFEIPFWDETLEYVSKIALFNPKNRSVGWDIGITENGPELIEGNHNWCKLLWQLPVKKGLKKELIRYL